MVLNESTLAVCARGFLSTLQSTLEQHELADFSRALQQVDTHKVQRGPLPPVQHQTLQYLHALMPEVSDTCLQTAAASLDWGQLYGGGGIDPVLAEGMFAAQAAGTYGVFAADHVACGFFLLAPGVHYPPHTHAAREVYYCLAGDIEIIHRLDEAPVGLSAGLYSETPSGRLHALRTGVNPALLAYIWIGDITAPTWWWAQDDCGQWIRTAWRRKPGEHWKAAQREPVDANDFQAAIQ